MLHSKFVSTENKGFQLTFQNGWTISVQWGKGNYCSNRNLETKDESMLEAKSAEIAIWDINNESYKINGSDLVLGWVTTDEVAEWIEKVKNFK